VFFDYYMEIYVDIVTFHITDLFPHPHLLQLCPIRLIVAQQEAVKKYCAKTNAPIVKGKSSVVVQVNEAILENIQI